MKITRLTTYAVPPRWLFLKIETDDGSVGWGEPIVEGRAATVAAAVDELSDALIGRDPRRIEDLWQLMYRGGFYRGGEVLMSAIAGVDQALWDLTARYHGVSVAELAGGPVRDRIRVYSHVGGGSTDELTASARAAVAGGFRAIKLTGTEAVGYVDSRATIDAAVARIAAVREAVGPSVDIAVDFHGRVHKPMARVLLRELEPCRLMFVEEPVLSENLDAVRDQLAGSAIPIALGERLFSRWDFKSVLASGTVDIIQPDPSHSGGITETRKIAAMAEAYDVALALHCPLGPIALAVCLQLDGICHNAVIQEQSLGIQYNTENDLLDYLVDPSVFGYTDGWVDIPRGPGLGIELDEAMITERAAVGHRWRNPLWRLEDGSVAEW
ncbi:galactonate dehydratase [Friedmanniella endophytica]|uniref:Galactonate dehydratase n=1 Tax=Microlunatus kandeliicorticis TaxID=1759536 RepID=A0A7W3P683_9ACTN|nr:galactonate dehydratase [Microlunatus kandeliicorticis]MBA8794791.1 galactonate dehydratase [Microlunatus kandeliicorticis]